MSSDNKRIKTKKTSKDLERLGIDGLKDKYLYSAEAIESIGMINNQFLNLAKEWSRSPMLEAVRHMGEQSRKLNEQYIGIAKSLSASIAPQLDAINNLSNVITPFAEQLADMHKPLSILNEAFSQQMWPLQEALKQINVANANSFRAIADTFRAIPREAILRIKLHSSYWLIVDEILLSTIVEKKLDLDTEAVPYLINYYKEDEWRRLELLVESWQTYISDERIKPFQSAMVVTKKSKAKDNVHLLTVPALIAQIDGIVRDLYALLPREIKKRVEQQIRESLAPELKGKRVDIRHNVAVQTIAEVVDFWSAEILQEIILGGLFRDSKEIKPEESYSLFRHKIMHGDEEYLKYQNEENFVRLMLYADFIVNLIKQIKNDRIALK